jgi:hypothetical protein
MPPGDRDRTRIDDVALDPVGQQQAMNPEPVQSRFLNDDRLDRNAVTLLCFARDRESSSSRQTPFPRSTVCLENFSLPGLLIVTSHFDLLNSSETNNLISFDRAVVAKAVEEVTDTIGCLHAGVEAQPTNSGRRPLA